TTSASSIADSGSTIMLLPVEWVPACPCRESNPATSVGVQKTPVFLHTARGAPCGLSKEGYVRAATASGPTPPSVSITARTYGVSGPAATSTNPGVVQTIHLAHAPGLRPLHRSISPSATISSSSIAANATADPL